MLSVPDILDDADSLTAALAYAGAGLYVLPVKASTKNPGSVVGGDWQRQSSRDPQQLTAWFAGTDHDIALHAGRSGLVVFDVDYFNKVPAVLKKHLDSAPHQSTRPDEPGRGHYLFAQPAGRSIGNGCGRLGSKWGDVRGLNGVIIAAPSDGGRYRWRRAGTVPVLPEDLGDQLDDGKPGADAVTDEQVRAFIAEHTAASRPGILTARVNGLAAKLEADEGRHTSVVPFLTGALEEARAGFYSAQAVVDEIAPLFVNAVQLGDKKRSEAAARAEFGGLLSWSVGQALAADVEKVRARVNRAVPDFDAVLRNSVKSSPSTGKPLPKVSTTVLSTVTAEKVQWLWFGRLPKGKICTLDGDPGLGKSTLAVDLIAHVTTGDAWPDDAIPEYVGNVVVLSAEDGLADTVRPRVDAAGGDSSKVIAINGVPVGYDDDGELIVRPLTLADTAAIEAAIVEYGAILAVIDVLMAYLPGSADSHRDQDVRRVFSQLSTIADRTGCTFLFIRHLTKGSGKGEPMYRGGGSIGIIGAARLGLAVARDPDDDDRRVLAVVKSNLAKIAPSLAYRLEQTPPHDVARVVWEGESEHTAADLLRDTGERSQPFSQVWLAAYLGDGRKLSADVKAAGDKMGIPQRTVQDAAKKLGVVYTNEGRSTYWQLPTTRAMDPERLRGCADCADGLTCDNHAGTCADDEPAQRTQARRPLGDTCADPPITAVEDPVCDRCGLPVDLEFGPRHPFCES